MHAYYGQADAFGVYCPETDRVYLVPVDTVGPNCATLRVEAPRNNQSKGVRWASDYELRPAGLAQLAEQLICNQQAVGSSPTPGSPV
jgi:hypothetical protein